MRGTGLPLDTTLLAPPGSCVVDPLTTVQVWGRQGLDTEFRVKGLEFRVWGSGSCVVDPLTTVQVSGR